MIAEASLWWCLADLLVNMQLLLAQAGHDRQDMLRKQARSPRLPLSRQGHWPMNLLADHIWIDSLVSQQSMHVLIHQLSDAAAAGYPQELLCD